MFFTICVPERIYPNSFPPSTTHTLLHVQDRKVTLDLVRRAEKAGYKALAVTVDTPVLGRREADIRNKFSLPAHLTMGKFFQKTHSLKINNLLETSASTKRITISVIPFGYPSSRVDVYFLICF